MNGFFSIFRGFVSLKLKVIKQIFRRLCGPYRTNVCVCMYVCHSYCITSIFRLYLCSTPFFLFKWKDTYTGYFSKLSKTPSNIGLLTVKLGILLSCAYLKYFKIVTYINVFTDNWRRLKWLDLDRCAQIPGH
jgi:hypothetical protein